MSEPVSVMGGRESLVCAFCGAAVVAFLVPHCEECYQDISHLKLEVVRAFVERVEALAKERNLNIADDWMHAIYDAFNDVKKETE